MYHVYLNVRNMSRTLIRYNIRFCISPSERTRAFHRVAPRGRPRARLSFAGSRNTLYWILRHLPNATGIAFEVARQVHALSRRDIALLDREIELAPGDYRVLLGNTGLTKMRASASIARAASQPCKGLRPSSTCISVPVSGKTGMCDRSSRSSSA
jgi:hypothetical protein